MGWLIIIVMVVFAIFGGGFAAHQGNIQEKCVAYYADMPHNKVQQHCEELLEFKK